MVDTVINLVKELPKEAVVLLLAALPISELRGAIPAGFAFGFSPLKSFYIAFIGNVIPVIPLLLFLKPVSEFLRKMPVLSKFFNWLFERTKRRADLVEKYEFLGLMLFVAIPLPITGAWTGCVAATLFKIRLRYAILAITLGVCIAAVIVTSVFFLGKGIFYRVFIPHY